MKTFSSRDFAPHRGTSFRLADVFGYDFYLAEVVDHSNARLEQFSLTFTCSVLPWLPQGTYTLVHPELADVVLFLVPIGPAGGAMRYESVFSRFIDGEGPEKRRVWTHEE